MTREELIEELNHISGRRRISALKKLKKAEKKDTAKPPKERHDDLNMRIHSFYSFSPYSPSKAVFMAYRSGLITLGLTDHDTLKGAGEFLKACDILGRASSVGFESRVHFDMCAAGITDKKDIDGDVYLICHGVPKSSFKKLKPLLEKTRAERLNRCRKLTLIMSEKFGDLDLFPSFESIVAKSKHAEGGSVTERHLLYALSGKILQKYGRGEPLIEYLKEKGYNIDGMERAFLLDVGSSYYRYDLLSVLKGDIKSFYTPKADECIDIEEFVKSAGAYGAVIAYPYMRGGAAKLDSAELDKLFSILKEMGINALSYEPNILSRERHKILRSLCEKYQLLELYSQEINSPRQKFENADFKKSEYQHFIKNAWAVIGHEKMSGLDLSNGMFTEKAISRAPKLSGRIELYAEIGRNFYKI